MTDRSPRSLQREFMLPAAAVLAAIAGLAIFALLPRTEARISRTALEIAGRTLSVPVTAGEIKTDFKTGAIAARDIRIVNPEGFSRPYVMTIGEIYLQARSLDPAALVFSSARISGVTVNLDVTAQGSNLIHLLRYINHDTAAQPELPGGRPFRARIESMAASAGTLSFQSIVTGVTLPPVALAVPPFVDPARPLEKAAPEIIAALAGHIVRAAFETAYRSGQLREAPPAVQAEAEMYYGINIGNPAGRPGGFRAFEAKKSPARH